MFYIFAFNIRILNKKYLRTLFAKVIQLTTKNNTLKWFFNETWKYIFKAKESQIILRKPHYVKKAVILRKQNNNVKWKNKAINHLNLSKTKNNYPLLPQN